MAAPLLVIAGPTASGKSALAIRLALALGGEIINADSQQVYRGLDLGTGKPSAGERAQVLHHLYDVADPGDQLDAAQFVALADRAIADVQSRGKAALLVGGTGLWIRALLFGLVDAPPRDDELRRSLEREAEERGLSALHARLGEVDPDSARKVSPTDPVRIVRALEVFALTGVPLSELHRRHARGRPRYAAVRIALDVPMPVLAERIRARVAEMFAAGLVEEAARADENPRSRERLHRVMGYREALAVLEGTLTRERATELVATAQRQYAKRQRTWFRAEPQWTWVAPERAFEVALGLWRTARDQQRRSPAAS